MDAPGGIKKYASGAVLDQCQGAGHRPEHPQPETSTVIGATATLEVTPAQAELLALSKSQGESDPDPSLLRGHDRQASAGAGPHLAEQVSAAPAIVKIFRNGSPSDVAVAR